MVTSKNDTTGLMCAWEAHLKMSAMRTVEVPGIKIHYVKLNNTWV